MNEKRERDYINIQGITQLRVVLNILYDVRTIVDDRRKDSLQNICGQLECWIDEQYDGLRADWKREEEIQKASYFPEVKASLEEKLVVFASYGIDVKCPGCGRTMLRNEGKDTIWCNAIETCKYFQKLFKVPKVKLEPLEV